jgi:hypothetical protein
LYLDHIINDGTQQEGNEKKDSLSARPLRSREANINNNNNNNNGNRRVTAASNKKDGKKSIVEEDLGSSEDGNSDEDPILTFKEIKSLTKVKARTKLIEMFDNGNIEIDVKKNTAWSIGQLHVILENYFYPTIKKNVLEKKYNVSKLRNTLHKLGLTSDGTKKQLVETLCKYYEERDQRYLEEIHGTSIKSSATSTASSTVTGNGS